MDGIAVFFYDCEDVTGKFICVVSVQKSKGMSVVHYADFDNVVGIFSKRRDLDVWVPNILRTLLANESGIIPRVKFSHYEYWEKEA